LNSTQEAEFLAMEAEETGGLAPHPSYGGEEAQRYSFTKFSSIS